MEFMFLQGRTGRGQFMLISLLPLAIGLTLLATTWIGLKSGVIAGLQLTGQIDTLLWLCIGAFLAWVFAAGEITRLHDIGQTGLWVLLNFIPVAGLFLWLFLLFAAGEAADNRYGPRPHKG